jgi:hypothetical protein
MVADPESLALNFEIPPIARGMLMQLPILGDFPRSRLALGTGDSRVGVTELGDQRFERLADAHQRRDALLVQLRQHLLVLCCRFAQSHAPIVVNQGAIPSVEVHLRSGDRG